LYGFKEFSVFTSIFNFKSLLKKIGPSNQNKTLDTDKTCFLVFGKNNFSFVKQEDFNPFLRDFLFLTGKKSISLRYFPD
jgi:hypothetical protein